MMTRAELAFSALDKDKKGYITAKELMPLAMAHAGKLEKFGA